MGAQHLEPSRRVEGNLADYKKTGKFRGRKESVEAGETDDEKFEAWELEDDEDDEDDQSDYDDSGGYTARTHQDLFSGVSKDSAAYEIDHFL
ncbi:unnamed protein product [Fusarium graminearum]|uniref:Uncharacterized protein n=1 Tax=Gibberella zeae TaxID=5518 RepID=A0A4E9EMX6_GIBZA|nr:unnamed protein product [Fusarium graminearum]